MLKKLSASFLISIISVSIFVLLPYSVLATGWTEQTTSGQRNWSKIASSADGTKLVATVSNGYIYTSTDSGATWVEQTGSGVKNWGPVASSDDGVNLVAGVSTGSGYLYTSSDSGVTWTQRNTTAGATTWSSVASSSDGSKLIAARTSGYAYTSTDSGVTWTERQGVAFAGHASVASSADGTKLVITTANSLYRSTDSGVNWSLLDGAGSHSWSSVASSDDGTRLVAGVSSDYVYVSADSGATWTQKTFAWGTWYVTSSGDGMELAAARMGGYVYISVDGGTTWTVQTSLGTKNFFGIASSDDGSKLATVVSGAGYVNTYEAPVNVVPVASSVTITGTPNIGQVMTGSYTYTDADTDAEGASTFRWLRDDVAIGSATASTYTTVQADVGTTLKFEVTPVAAAGLTPGVAVTSVGTAIVVAVPSITTSAATSLEKSTATLNGSISATGGEDATQSGFKYGTVSDLSTLLATSTLGAQVGTASFTEGLTGLHCHTTYYFRAYATNSAGTTNGSILSFDTKNCPTLVSSTSTTSGSSSSSTTSSATSTTTTTSPTTTTTTPTTTTTTTPRTTTTTTTPTPTTTTTTTPTTTTTTTAPLVLGTTVLKVGSVGEPVKEIQHFLNETLDLNLAVDGKLGPNTIAAIKTIQAEHGLVADGIIGPKTKAVLSSITSVSTAPASAPALATTTVLKVGSVGEPVKQVQQFLNTTLNVNLAVDGKLGPNTIAVVKKWQAANGLVADGIIGPKTKAKMDSLTQ